MATRGLSVRSALLSLALGAHPEVLTAGTLVAVAAHFGIGDNAARVALSRAVAADDLVRTDDGYALGPSLLARQARQEEAVAPRPSSWAGDWEAAAVVATGRPPADRTALRALLEGHRLGELREGLWTRPANLRRPPGYADHPDLLVHTARHDDPAGVAARLWDLDGWSRTGDRLLEDFRAADDPAERLARGAGLVRHLGSDPILPPGLLPAGWSGDRLRDAYAAYQAELGALVLSLRS